MTALKSFSKANAMSPSAKKPPSTQNRFRLFAVSALSCAWTYLAIGIAVLLLDVCTGPFLLFPIVFVIPVAFAAWFCSARLAYVQAFLLPVGRLFIAEFVDHPSPFPFIVANCLIRVAVLALLAFLVSRTSRQTKELERRVNDFVTICAWSKTVEYNGEWISYEEYLKRRFNITTSHGISPVEFEKIVKKAVSDPNQIV